MTVLGLDIGRKRVGVALLKDELVIELETVSFKTFEELVERLEGIVAVEAPSRLVVGLPRGSQAQEIQKISQDLVRVLHLPLDFEDETLTSREAIRQLKQEGLSQKEAEEKSDQRAARLILEQYQARQKRE